MFIAQFFQLQEQQLAVLRSRTDIICMQCLDNSIFHSVQALAFVPLFIVSYYFDFLFLFWWGEGGENKRERIATFSFINLPLPLRRAELQRRCKNHAAAAAAPLSVEACDLRDKYSCAAFSQGEWLLFVLLAWRSRFRFPCKDVPPLLLAFVAFFSFSFSSSLLFSFFFLSSFVIIWFFSLHVFCCCFFLYLFF